MVTSAGLDVLGESATYRYDGVPFDTRRIVTPSEYQFPAKVGALTNAGLDAVGAAVPVGHVHWVVPLVIPLLQFWV
jgi:hypothetical protein